MNQWKCYRKSFQYFTLFSHNKSLLGQNLAFKKTQQPKKTYTKNPAKQNKKPQPTSQPTKRTNTQNPKQNQKERCNCHHILSGTISATTSHGFLLLQPCQAPADAVLAKYQLLNTYATYSDLWPLTTHCPVLPSHPAGTSSPQRCLVISTLSGSASYRPGLFCWKACEVQLCI